jgi:hypothetical protein
LAPDDPDRRAAFEHARTCPTCAEALEEAASMLPGLDEAVVLPLPSPGALERAARVVRADLQRQRARRWRAAAPLMAATLAAWLIPLGGGLRLRDSAGAAVSLALALVAAVSAAATVVLGGRVLLILPLTSFAAAWLAGGSGPAEAAHGLHCAGLELALSVIPLALATALARRGLLDRPVSALAAAGAGGALSGQAVLHVTCFATSHAHLLAFHAGPVVVTMAGAALLTKVVRGSRPASPP